MPLALAQNAVVKSVCAPEIAAIYPIAAHAGETVALSVQGTGFTAPLLAFLIEGRADPDIAFKGEASGNGIGGEVTIAPSARLGGRDVCAALPSGACAGKPLSGAFAVVAPSAPIISSVTPGSFQPDVSQDTRYLIEGTNLKGATGVVFLDSKGTPDSTIAFHIDPAGGAVAGQLAGNITMSGRVWKDIAKLYITTTAGNSNPLPFEIQGDLTPYVGGVTPGSLHAGESATLVIEGTTFGPGCGPNANTPCPGAAVRVCRGGADPCTTPDVAVSDIAWGDTEITATFTAAASASGRYDVKVVSAGATGKGFLAWPLQSSSSNPSLIVVLK
jgi:hypothetical protein